MYKDDHVLCAMNTLNYPLNNGQVELMKLFGSDLSDADLADLKKLLSGFFAEKAITAADKIWDKKGLTNEDMDRLLGEHN